MAKLNELGNIIASCPSCDGATSTFEYIVGGQPLGHTVIKIPRPYNRFGELIDLQFRLFRCAGCGMGALAAIRMEQAGASYPTHIWELCWFMPEAKPRLALPANIPEGIKREFREGERCLENDCIRAAAGMFRSVLDKTLLANGYKESRRTTLQQQIDDASKDGVITESRKRKAHEEIRVLGNDVLHDEWHEIAEEDVQAARHYVQRILEDFYDDRESVLKLLREAGRIPDEDREDQSKEGS